MGKISPNFKTEKIDMFKEIELPEDLKGSIIKSIKKEKRKNSYKAIITAAAILLMIIVPGYFYLYNVKNNDTNDYVAMKAKGSSSALQKSKYNDQVKSSKTESPNKSNKYGKANISKQMDLNKTQVGTKVIESEAQDIGKVSQIKTESISAIKNNKQDKLSKESSVKKNSEVLDKSNNNGKDKKNKQNSIYSGQVAINQNENAVQKPSYKLSQSNDSQRTSKKNNNTITPNNQNRTNETTNNVNLNSKQNKASDIDIDGIKSSDNSSETKTADLGNVAIANGGNAQDKTSTVNTDAIDKSNSSPSMKTMLAASSLQPVINISFTSNVDKQELKNLIEKMNIKNYTVQDNQIEITCNVKDYENIKEALNKIYTDEVKYIEPKDISSNENLEVKLIIQF